MYQVKLFNKISKVGLDRLDPAEYTYSEDFDQYDAVLVRSAKLHDTKFPENLKCIARAGAGVNNIPLDRCAEEGIVVFNTPGANANAVKELVVCGLMLASRDIVGGIEWTKSLAGTPDIGPAAEKGKSKFAGPEIMGKRLGVIGLGAIGVQVANAAVGLDMEVWGYDPYLSVDGALKLSRAVKHITDVSEIFANCDYITLHVPLTPDTKYLINEDAVAKMKDGVRIINIARGELVDEDVMAAALACGKVARYVSDFASDAMLAQKNAVIMPHLGASTPESEDNCAKMAAAEIREFLEYGTIRNSVNFPNLKVPYEGGHRLCLIHKNVPNMIAQITSTLSAQGMNIENMGNRSRGDYAYTIVDVNGVPTDAVLDAIRAVDGMMRVRSIENP